MKGAPQSVQALPVLRECLKCGEFKPRDREHFVVAGGYLTHTCRECRRAFDRARNRRPNQRRARTVNVQRLSRIELEVGRATYPEPITGKPRTRAECVGAPRPCPYVSCKHHLYLDVNPGTGSIKLNFPDLEVWELGESCVLDVADHGVQTLDQVGPHLNLTRERIRQLELKALLSLDAAALSEFVDL